MKKIKVALIDSGINSDFISKCEIVNVDFGNSNSYYDDIFHGTVCAHIISEIMKEGQIYNIKIIDNTIHTNSKKLLKAISWCIENHMDIVNISLSIADMNYYYEFNDICYRAFLEGCIIIAAASNAGFYSLPAYMQYVCGVGTAQIPPEQFVYKKDAQIQYYTNGTNPLSTEKSKFSHSSFAAARITGRLGVFLQASSLKGINALKEFNNLAISTNNSMLHINYKIFNFEANTLPININKIPINDRLLGTKKIFLGSVKECKMMKEYNSCVNFDNIISTAEGSSERIIIPEEINNVLITGRMPESTLNNIICSNKSINIYSLFPLKNSNNNRIKYLFKFSEKLNSLIADINDEHIFMNLKLNLLLVNLAYTDILNLELFIVNLIGEQKCDTALISNNPLSVLFGFDFITKDVLWLKYLPTYIKTLVETYNREHKQYIIMSTNSPYKIQNKNFEEDFIYFTSLLLSFFPDKILLVIDKFTTESHIEHTIRYLKGFINAPIVSVIYIEFDVFFDYNFSIITKNKYTDIINEGTIDKINKIFVKYNYKEPLVVNYSDSEQIKKIKNALFC